MKKCYIPFGGNATAAREECEAWDLAEMASSRLGSRGGGLSDKPWEALPQWLKYIVFDVVYVDGPSAVEMARVASARYQYMGGPDEDSGDSRVGEITHYPLAVRRCILEQAFVPIDNRLEMVDHKVVASTDRGVRLKQLEDCWNDVNCRGAVQCSRNLFRMMFIPCHRQLCA